MLTYLALAFSIFATVFSLLAVRFAVKFSAASVAIRKLTALEVAITDHEDSLAALHAMLKKLRSRIGMRELRKRRQGEPDEPDDDLSTEAGRTAARTRLESQLASSGRLNARSHLRSN